MNSFEAHSLEDLMYAVKELSALARDCERKIMELQGRPDRVLKQDVIERYYVNLSEILIKIRALDMLIKGLVQH